MEEGGGEEEGGALWDLFIRRIMSVVARIDSILGWLRVAFQCNNSSGLRDLSETFLKRVLLLFLAGGVVEGHGGEAEEGRGGGGQWGVEMGQVELLRLLFIFRFSASRSVGFLGFLRFCRDSAKILEGKWLPTPPPYLPLPPTKSIRMIETSYLWIGRVVTSVGRVVFHLRLLCLHYLPRLLPNPPSPPFSLLSSLLLSSPSLPPTLPRPLPFYGEENADFERKWTWNVSQRVQTSLNLIQPAHNRPLQFSNRCQILKSHQSKTTNSIWLDKYLNNCRMWWITAAKMAFKNVSFA